MSKPWDFPFPSFEAQLARVCRHLVFRRKLRRLGTGSFVSPYAQLQGMPRISIGERTQICRRTLLQVLEHYEGADLDAALSIGDDVYVGSGCTLSTVNRIEVGNQVTFGDNVYVADGGHGYEMLDRSVLRQPLTQGEVRIGDGAWLGYGSVVVGRVDIGSHAVIGANSVVTKSVPPRVVVAGAPAVIIKRYDETLGRWVKAS